MNENDMTNFLRLRKNVELEHPLEPGMAVIRLPCSPKAHTGLIVLLGRRCSLKRAVGDELATILKKQQASLEGSFIRRCSLKGAVRGQSASILREARASLEGSFIRRCSLGKACVSAHAGLGG